MDSIEKYLTSPNDQEQVVTSKRDDATFTYRRRWREGNDWGPLGPERGIYVPP